MVLEVQPTVTVVSCSNSDEILGGNLLISPDVVSGALPVQVLTGKRSAASAYAEVLASPPTPIVVFAHQDIYFPEGWLAQLQAEIRRIEAIDPDWALIGTYGARSDGRHFGYLYDTSTRRVLGVPLSPERVAILDEIVIVVRAASGVNFDPDLPGFHLYATDIALQAAKSGKSVWAAHVPVVHNSASIPTLDATYEKAWKFVSRKWRAAAPYPNLMTQTMGSSDWPLLRWRLRNKLLLWRGKRKLYERVSDPVPYAEQIKLS